jgi:hypothetical protein
MQVGWMQQVILKVLVNCRKAKQNGLILFLWVTKALDIESTSKTRKYEGWNVLKKNIELFGYISNIHISSTWN